MPYAPTPIRTRPYHFIKQLSRNGHALTLATLFSDETEEQSLAQWRAAGIQVIAAPLSRQRSLWNTLQAVAGSAPLQAAYCWQPQLIKRVLEALEHTNFDVMQIEHLRGAWYGIAAQTQLKKTAPLTPVLWDSVDCITHLFTQASRSSTTLASRWMTRLELTRTRRYEKNLARRFAKTLVVSEKERQAFCEILESKENQVRVVPNGVDLEAFAPGTTPRAPATILLTGKMSYHANVTAAFFLLDEILPRVRRTIPKVRVQIVGQNPPNALLKRRNAYVEITGQVPSLRPYLNRATVACAPIRYGAGTQNKVLEAMAAGTAVVATPQAIEALMARPEQELLVGTDAEELSRQILRVLTDDALRTRLQVNGRHYVETNHQWANSVHLLEEIYAQAIHETSQYGGISSHVHA